jgi:hypothetical protein
MNAHQLLINELLNETSSSSEKNCKNCQLRINCGSWLGITSLVFRMNRSSMQFIPFEFLNSEDNPSRLCKIKSMAEKYVMAFLWLVILGALENYVVIKAKHMLLDIIHVFTNQSAD